MQSAEQARTSGGAPSSAPQLPPPNPYGPPPGVFDNILRKLGLKKKDKPKQTTTPTPTTTTPTTTPPPRR